MGLDTFAGAFALDCVAQNYTFGVRPSFTLGFSNVNSMADKRKTLPDIKRVVYNDPATIVFWEDGSKTVVKCQKKKGDVYSRETGLAMAIVKKAYGNKGSFNDVFTKWLPNKEDTDVISGG